MSAQSSLTPLTPLVYSMFTVYSTSSQIGSPKRMHDLLSEVSRLSPVKNNQDGSCEYRSSAHLLQDI